MFMEVIVCNLRSLTVSVKKCHAVEVRAARCRAAILALKTRGYFTYFTEIVTPLWLASPPIETTIGKSPESTVAGICTFNCITPDTNPGASPAKLKLAACPLIDTEVRSSGPGVNGGAVATVVTFPVTPAG